MHRLEPLETVVMLSSDQSWRMVCGERGEVTALCGNCNTEIKTARIRRWRKKNSSLHGAEEVQKDDQDWTTSRRISGDLASTVEYRREWGVLCYSAEGNDKRPVSEKQASEPTVAVVELNLFTVRHTEFRVRFHQLSSIIFLSRKYRFALVFARFETNNFYKRNLNI